MVAVSAPSVVTPLIVNRAVVLPGSTVAPVTVAPAIPESTSELVVTDEGASASLNVTSYVNGPGNTNSPPTVGLVETTWIALASYRNVVLNAVIVVESDALVIEPAATVIVCVPSAVTGDTV